MFTTGKAAGCACGEISCPDPEPVCSDSQKPRCDQLLLSGVANNFFSGIYPQFCDAVNANKTKQISKDNTNEDIKAPSKRSIFSRTPPPSAGQYDEYTFHFDWGGGDGNCHTDYTGAYSALVQSPSGNSGGEQNSMTLTGSYDVGCGTYAYEVTPKPSNAYRTDDSSYVDLNTATNNVKTFCDKIANMATVQEATEHDEMHNVGSAYQLELQAQ